MAFFNQYSEFSAIYIIIRKNQCLLSIPLENIMISSRMQTVLGDREIIEKNSLKTQGYFFCGALTSVKMKPQIES